MNFNKEQRKAILHKDGPMMVLAGPGSGKTTMIVYRIGCLLMKHRIDPASVLVLTYTKAAAGEMQERFYRMEELHTLSEQEKKKVTFGTFHSCFWRMLRENGLARDCVLMEEAEKEKWFRNWLQTYSTYSGIKIEQETERLLSFFGKRNCQLQHSPLTGTEKAIWDGFCAYKERERKIDFDDMMLLTLKMLEDPFLLSRLRQRFPYVLVDEFQDVNPVQYEILKRLVPADGNLFIVGDDDQAIYGFRGAQSDIMLTVPEDYPGIKILSLRYNYRSCPQIVDFASVLIRNNKKRFDKNLKSARKKESLLSVWKEKRMWFRKAITVRSYPTRARECGAVACWASQGEESGQTMAVLLRTIFGAEPLERALQHYGICYRIGSRVVGPWHHFLGDAFWMTYQASLGEKTEAEKLYAALYPNSTRAIFTWLKPEQTMEQLSTASLDEELRLTWEEFLFHLRHFAKEPPRRGAERLLYKMGFEKVLEQWCEKEELPWALMKERIRFWKKDLSAYKSWEQWREHRIQKRQEPENEPTVRIMTVHASKGLEFERVWIPFLVEGLFPHERNESLEEERRLFYVGLTRAKDVLVLSAHERVKEEKKTLSRFYYEAGQCRFGP